MLIEQMIENLRLKDINPLICGSHDCPKSHAYGPAMRSYYLMHYVHSGRGVLHNERGEHIIRKGQIFMIHPYEVTTYIADDKDPWTYSWIGFDANDYIGNLLGEDIYEAERCAGIFKDMNKMKLDSGREFYLCGKLYEILAAMEQTKASEREDSSSRYVRIARNYIESNYHKDVRVSQIAENMGLDRSYFTHLFTAEVNQSPQQYLLKLRMAKAIELLENSEQLVGEIAIQVGYPDVTNFSRMFKRHVGISPSQYRKNR